MCPLLSGPRRLELCGVLFGSVGPPLSATHSYPWREMDKSTEAPSFMPNRNPADLGCAHGETHRKDQENKGRNGVRELRGCCSQTVQGAQVRDNQGQKGLSLQFGVGHALASDARSYCNHALQVIHLTVVERECSLVYVARRVLACIVRVRALPRSLIERPEVLNPVGMNVTAHVLTGPVVHGEVVVVAVKADIRGQLVGVNSRARLNPCSNACLKGLGRNRVNHRRDDWPTALQRTVNRNLVGSTSSVNLALAVHGVHVPGKSTNVGFVSLDGARQLLKRPACHCKTNPVVHEPRRLLGHAKGTAQLTRRDAVLRVGDEPDGGEPLVKAKSRVLEDGSDLDRELTLARFALPNLAGGNEGRVSAATTRARNLTVRPAEGLDELEATVSVREVADGLNEGIGKVWSRVLHDLIFPGGCDMYISPLISAPVVRRGDRPRHRGRA